MLDDVRAHAPASDAFVADLADLDALPALAERVETTIGPVDVLVNNVGVPSRRRMQDITPDEVADVLRINFLSAVTLTSALLPGMLERGRGRIVNVSSMGTRTAAVRVGAYAASKAALELWTEGLLLDLLGTGVTAQVLVPGTTRTEFALPRDDRDEPFPADPNALEPEVVADALVDAAALRSLRGVRERGPRRSLPDEAHRSERVPRHGEAAPRAGRQGASGSASGGAG